MKVETTAKQNIASQPRTAIKEPRTRSLIGMPHRRTYDGKFLNLSSGSDFTVEILHEKMKMRVASIYWGEGLKVDIGSMKQLPESPSDLNSLDDFIIEVNGLRNETGYASIQRAMERRKLEEERKLRDPNLNGLLVDGNEVSLYQIPSGVRIYGNNCNINIK